MRFDRSGKCCTAARLLRLNLAADEATLPTNILDTAVQLAITALKA